MEQFRSKHKQTQSEREAEMSKKVLEFVRSELYMDLRFLDIALGTLVYRADENIRSFATDGTYLYFSTEQVLRVFQSNPKYLDRAYLHSVLHCIFFHLWIGGKRDRENGSCLRYCGGIHDRPDGQTEYEADLKLAETNGL